MSDADGGKGPGELPPERPTGSSGPAGEGGAERRSGSSGRPDGERRDASSERAGGADAEGRETPDSRRIQGSSDESANGAHGAGDGAGREEGEAAASSSAQPGTGTGTGTEPGGERTGRQRLAAAVWPPRVTRAQLIVALLLFVLGLGLAIQVRSTSENSSLRGARQEDLVRILDELDDRTKRLEDEKQSLEGQRTELENSSDQAEEARKQTRQKARQLGVLAGTVGARGPGIELTITDPGNSVEADMLLDAVQELRAAGAEAIEVNNVRVVANTYFSDSAGGVSVDGHKISPPYRFQVIGKPKDLEPALNIPGGVVQTLRKEQADASVRVSQEIVINALRSAKRPDYARSSAQ
ncbi:uncharacterized protein YlxW (UPF0749 family) [Streptomyces sp. Amel2xB2]|uniref:DUF881 domain-containing protein n=1 Tax=Streptomyces sp. Amel2xB2 TaxID=1305829 RepID=UPI000DB947FC|nr:DUF881 domain-containing protein [Streptomyces sp. Amel2xB2]RAJ57525.1 uncharacterized protein YlxW (UPF0749 family) [Streptomyces sp. Amel2xB2]